ncbi:HNH endonuclease signature motif containing protein [Streptomyces sp. NPDC048057]|uniref:HNH endonuclease signature motif containing protein n=1 Tax=Streptomyces sp. NPDC048057 TaxID=3155628 RepID=UPI0033F9B9E7
MPREWADRFLAYVTAAPGGCWQWTGYLMPNGYARFSVAGERRYAHRVAYEAVHGPIPDRLVIDHLCRNRGCVNPDHLEAVTQRINVLRGVSFAAARARQIRCLRGHRFTVANTYVARNGTRKCRTCRAAARARSRRRRGVSCAAA